MLKCSVGPPFRDHRSGSVGNPLTPKENLPCESMICKAFLPDLHPIRKSQPIDLEPVGSSYMVQVRMPKKPVQAITMVKVNMDNTVKRVYHLVKVKSHTDLVLKNNMHSITVSKP